MAKLSKRAQAIREKIRPGQAYPAADAFDLLRDLSKVKFRESVDVAVNLGVDPRKSDQVVRGSTVLPNGTGKSVRVAVFTVPAGTRLNWTVKAPPAVLMIASCSPLAAAANPARASLWPARSAAASAAEAPEAE